MPEHIASGKSGEILVRSLEGLDEIRVCLDLQREIWRYNETDLVPEAMLVVARESGGQVIAAFHEVQPVGFILAFTGTRHGGGYLHSHMLGVRSEFRNCGVGRLLKLKQREDAVARGFDLIEWTFDPLQLKNAYFNVARLGAIVRQYQPNLYGRTSSPLHSGLPTDRLVAQWWVRSPRVEEALAGNKTSPHRRRTLISIPRSIRKICDESPLDAERIQTQLREQFQHHFALGHAVVGFDLDAEQGSYILEPYES